jgi:hypothetical protein
MNVKALKRYFFIFTSGDVVPIPKEMYKTRVKNQSFSVTIFR